MKDGQRLADPCPGNSATDTDSFRADSDSFQKVYPLMGSIVRIEMFASSVVMLIGLFLIALHGENAGPFVFSELPSLLIQGNGVAITYVGIFILLFVPVSYVMVAFGTLIVSKEYTLASVTAALLVLLALGTLLGVGG